MRQFDQSSPAQDGKATESAGILDMNQIVSTDPGPPATLCANQLGAVCWRLLQGEVQILLITSRDTGRWVIPKGWPMAGKSMAEAAAIEAWEEAGVEGRVHDVVLGQFTYDKLVAAKPSIPCLVTVFGLQVAQLKRRFPERKQRRRKWFSLDQAQLLVAEPGLGALLRDIPGNPAYRAAASLDPA
jgi:8-oxo-dGTP pyrophosphatase MutT (NUDIX family)